MSARSSRLLIDEHPLQVLPSLAVAVGLEKAIILQQIHYWTESTERDGSRRGKLRDGYFWTFNTAQDWHRQFPFMSVRSIQRHFAELERMDPPLVISTDQYNTDRWNRTKWSRLNYDALDRLAPAQAETHDENASLDTASLADSGAPDWRSHEVANLAVSKTETNAETNQTETTSPAPASGRDGVGSEPASQTAKKPAAKPKAKDDPELMERFDRFWAAYPKKAGKPDALRAWRSKKPDEATTERIIAAIAEHARAHDWTPERKRFIPNPSTWLNQERWEDELEVDLPASAAATDRPASTIEEAAEIARATVRFSARAYLATTAHPMTPAQIERSDRGEPLEDVLTATQLDLARQGRSEAHNRAMMFSRSGGNF